MATPDATNGNSHPMANSPSAISKQVIVTHISALSTLLLKNA